MSATASGTRVGRRDRLSNIRRQSILDTSDLQVNDDEEERNCRRQMRVLDDQEKNLSSPSTPSKRRLVLGTALSGLSNEELSEHYKECVRLSTENKITKKNAFQLHLIDYMADTIKKSGNEMNFQVASCALDASAKIYGYRVDALEADTCKLASNLGRTHKATEENDSQLDPESQELRKKKRKVKKSSKIELNLKSITLDKIDQRSELGSFQNQFASGFDEQGVAGLFLYNLPISDDRCQLTLDYTQKPPALDSTRMYETDAKINISDIKPLISELLRKITEGKSTIDVAFEDFDFNQVDVEMSDLENASQNTQPPDNNPAEFVFNGDVVEADDDLSNHGFDPLDVEDDAVSDMIVNVAGQRNNSIGSQRFENINDTIGFLTSKPSEYSYYDPKFKSAWAGPNHWRFLPFTRRPAINKQQAPIKRKPKINPKMDYSLPPPEIIHNEAKNVLSKVAMQRWSKEKTELPFDHHYDMRTLSKSMINTSLWIRALKKAPKAIDADVGDGDLCYNYDNPADKSNYCGTEESSDDEHEPPAASSLSEDFRVNQDMEFSFTQNAPTQSQQVAFTGDNLVQQPYKIDKPYLAYEKTAKKIDAKRIKHAMWNILSGNEDAEVMTSSFKFSELYREIPKHVSETTSKNMSVPIALVTFLHLCNEKVLSLTKQSNMSDFKIEQG